VLDPDARKRFLDFVTRITQSPYDFSVRQVATLLVCAETISSADRQTHRIAEALNFSRPVVCRATDRLEEAGFIERQELPGDRRACVLAVTKSGHQFIQMIYGEKTPATKRVKPSDRRRERAAAA
jgi:DNA-binding MarR family transcriptional regulator